MTGRRRLESRYAIYQPSEPPRRLYQPSEVLRLAIVDFEGFEEYGAGTRLVEKIKTELATLAASHRYCLTGTPVGHSLQDLYGQVSKLRRISRFVPCKYSNVFIVTFLASTAIL